MMEHFVDTVFRVFNPVHMALGSAILAFVNIYLSFLERTWKTWPRRLKALNWFWFGLTFFVIYINSDLPAMEQRAWLRLAFGLLVIGEISYYGDVFVDIAHRVTRRLKETKKHD